MTKSRLVRSLARGLYSYGLAVVVGAIACDGGDRRTDSTAGSASNALVSVDTVEPQPVQWEPARLDTLLRAKGYRPGLVPLPARNPFVNVPAVSYRLDDAELDAYFFGDPVAAARGIGRVAPRAGAVTTFTSNNMLIVVRSKDEELRERIRRLLTDSEVKGTLTP